jgi:hypothetical protein
VETGTGVTLEVSMIIDLVVVEVFIDLIDSDGDPERAISVALGLLNASKLSQVGGEDII